MISDGLIFIFEKQQHDPAAAMKFLNIKLEVEVTLDLSLSLSLLILNFVLIL